MTSERIEGGVCGGPFKYIVPWELSLQQKLKQETSVLEEGGSTVYPESAEFLHTGNTSPSALLQFPFPNINSPKATENILSNRNISVHCDSPRNMYLGFAPGF